MNKLSIFSLLLLLVIASGCKKDLNIGEDIINLQDQKLNVVFTDTVSIIAYSLPVDSVTASKLSYNILGSQLDPVFGTTTASIYTQLRLSQNNVDFGTGAVCDSIILTLDYAGFYGDSNQTQTIRVFEVTEDMFFDTTYYSNKTLQIDPIELGSYTGAFNLTDSLLFDGSLTEPHLVIRLKNSFGDKIISKSGGSELADNDAFLQFLKGIHITADKATSKGGLAYLDLMSSLSVLTLYYHNDTDTLNYKFSINESCSYFSNFNHYNYADASPEFKSQVVLKDSSFGNQTLYVQSMGGVKTKLYFPHLKQLLADGPIAVQNAELVITAKTGSTDEYTPVYSLATVKLDSAGIQQFINDYYEGSAYFGGDYNETSKSYSFNINRYIQSVLLDKENQYGLELIAKGSSIYGNRLIFAGPKSTEQRLKLRLTYTKVN